MANITPFRPYKSVAAALMFTVVLGPVGLLYASYWGGVLMVVIGTVVVCNKYFFPIVLLWLICTIWAVGAVESYNRKLEKVRTSDS